MGGEIENRFCPQELITQKAHTNLMKKIVVRDNTARIYMLVLLC